MPGSDATFPDPLSPLSSPPSLPLPAKQQNWLEKMLNTNSCITYLQVWCPFCVVIILNEAKTKFWVGDMRTEVATLERVAGKTPGPADRQPRPLAVGTVLAGSHRAPAPILSLAVNPAKSSLTSTCDPDHQVALPPADHAAAGQPHTPPP